VAMFLFREVLGIELGDMERTVRARRGQGLPTVLASEEVRRWRHVTDSWLQRAVSQAAHTLRHNLATHLLVARRSLPLCVSILQCLCLIQSRSGSSA
jgi:hypothetical protein